MFEGLRSLNVDLYLDQQGVDTTTPSGRALVGNLRAAADEGNIVANIFLLKARHQYREGEAIEANLSVNVNTGGVLVVPAKQSVEDFLQDAEMRNVTPTAAQDR